MKPKSHTLFHFTQSRDVLEQILKYGFWPRYCLEDLTWYIHPNERFAFPMVCFCDIPLSRISDHVGLYGKYGIGVTRDWVLKSKLNPVTYLSETSNYAESLKKLYNEFQKSKHKFYPNAGGDLNQIISHIKPLEGKTSKGKKNIVKEFYQENEWRFVPKNKNIDPWLSEEIFNSVDDLNFANDASKKLCSLKITPNDIKYIFVENDSDILEMIKFINGFYGDDQDIKLLTSRLISIESIKSDL